MRRLLLAAVSTLTAFALVAPTVSQKASAQLFEDMPPEGADPAVTHDRGPTPDNSEEPDHSEEYDDGFSEGYDAGYQDAASGREYDPTYEGYDDDDSIRSEVGGVSRDGSEDDEGLEPRFEEEFEETLRND